MFMAREKAEKLVDDLIEAAGRHRSFGVSRLDVLRQAVIDELVEPNFIDTDLFIDEEIENEDNRPISRVPSTIPRRRDDSDRSSS